MNATQTKTSPKLLNFPISWLPFKLPNLSLKSTQFPTAKAITILPPLPLRQPALRLKIPIADSKIKGDYYERY